MTCEIPMYQNIRTKTLPAPTSTELPSTHTLTTCSMNNTYDNPMPSNQACLWLKRSYTHQYYIPANDHTRMDTHHIRLLEAIICVVNQAVFATSIHIACTRDSHIYESLTYLPHTHKLCAQTTTPPKKHHTCPNGKKNNQNTPSDHSMGPNKLVAPEYLYFPHSRLFNFRMGPTKKIHLSKGP